MALEALFDGKCAYCESDLLNCEWDVEHFRPKGRVAENDKHPGYYWLTYEWTNLYPACKFCNQRRRDKPMWGDLTEAVTAGKLDQFPLADENSRIFSHEQQDKMYLEQRLLLDPCEDDPELFLRFDLMGQIHAVQENSQGKATIAICHLTRRRLRVIRKKIARELLDWLILTQNLEASGKTEAAQELRTFLCTRSQDNTRLYVSVERYVLNHPDEFGF